MLTPAVDFIFLDLIHVADVTNRGAQEGSSVVAIKEFKGLSDMEDEHIRKYVRLTQVI